MNLKVRDLVRDFATRESFEQVLEQMRAAAGDVIEGSAFEKSVDKLGSILAVPQKRRSMILEGLIETRGQEGYAGQPVSRATMMNAVTAVANRPDVSPDDVDDWQRLGGRVLNMSKADWSAVNTASLVAASKNANPAGVIRQGFFMCSTCSVPPQLFRPKIWERPFKNG